MMLETLFGLAMLVIAVGVSSLFFTISWLLVKMVRSLDDEDKRDQPPQ